MALRQQVAAELQRRGYRGRRGTLGLPLDEDFSYVVVIGSVSQRSDVVAPGVGLCCVPVEGLLVDLGVVPALESPLEFRTTVGANVGYVLGEGYRSFQPPASVGDVIETIDAGLHVLDAYRSVPGVAVGIDAVGGAASYPGASYARVVACHLAGDAQGMERALERARVEYLRYPDDEIAATFREFERRLSARRSP